MTQPVLNQDPIEIVTWRVLPSGEVEALMRLSERDMALLEDKGARYSIEPNPRCAYEDGPFRDLRLDGIPLDGGPVGEAAEEGKDIERLVTATLDLVPPVRLPGFHRLAPYLNINRSENQAVCNEGLPHNVGVPRRDGHHMLFTKGWTCLRSPRHDGAHVATTDLGEGHDIDGKRTYWFAEWGGRYGAEHVVGFIGYGQAPALVEQERQDNSCKATTVFWPEVEACDATCDKPKGHEPANIHEDRILGEWDEDGD